MGTILNTQKLNELSKLKKDNPKLVLVGGCFDIIHPGHIDFLTKAKQLGDILIVMLEPDAKITKLKGKDRPVNRQEVRSINLSNINEVDIVLKLGKLKTDSDYEALVKKIQPDIIAATDQDRLFPWEKNYTVRVIKRKSNYSTSGIINRISAKG